MRPITSDCRERACVAVAGAERVARMGRASQVTWVPDLQKLAAATARLAYAVTWELGDREAEGWDLVLTTLARLNSQRWGRISGASVSGQHAALALLVRGLAAAEEGERHLDLVSPLDADLARRGERAAALALALSGGNDVAAAHALIGVALGAIDEAW